MTRWTVLLLLSGSGCGSSDTDFSGGLGFVVGGSGGLDFSGGAGGAEHGPENSWWHTAESALPADLVGTGSSTGDIIQDFTMSDQFGDEVELYQFYGQVIVLDLYAEW